MNSFMLSSLAEAIAGRFGRPAFSLRDMDDGDTRRVAQKVFNRESCLRDHGPHQGLSQGLLVGGPTIGEDQVRLSRVPGKLYPE
jgi:hypothetical protein